MAAILDFMAIMKSETGGRGRWYYIYNDGNRQTTKRDKCSIELLNIHISDENRNDYGYCNSNVGFHCVYGGYLLSLLVKKSQSSFYPRVLPKTIRITLSYNCVGTIY